MTALKRCLCGSVFSEDCWVIVCHWNVAEVICSPVQSEGCGVVLGHRTVAGVIHGPVQSEGCGVVLGHRTVCCWCDAQTLRHLCLHCAATQEDFFFFFPRNEPVSLDFS